MDAATTTRCDRSGAWDRKQPQSQLLVVGNVAMVSMSTDVLRKQQETTPHHRTTINSMYVQDTSWVVRACGIIGAALGNGQTCRWRIIGNRRKSGLWSKVLVGAQKIPPQVSSSFTALPKGIMREWYLGVPGIGRGWATGNTSCGSNSH